MTESCKFYSSDAYKLLSSEMAEFRELPYDELVQLIGPTEIRRVRADDSIEYAVQITIRWRDQEYGDIVIDGWVAVDDCGPMRRLDERIIVETKKSSKERISTPN